MDLRFTYTWFVAAFALTLGGSLARGQSATFEELDLMRSRLETTGGMVNRGDGYFYAASRYDETAKGGVIFRVASHQEPEILHTFSPLEAAPAVNDGGTQPSTLLVLGPDGALYGATSDGGAHGYGTIYRLSIDGIFSVLYDFSDTDGIYPAGLVITPEGDIYGVTNYGGHFGGGTIFRISSDGVFQTVYNFKYNENSATPGIRQPYSPLKLALGKDGKIYGITELGGRSFFNKFTNYYTGTLFRLNGPDDLTILTTFESLGIHPKEICSVDDGFYVTTDHHFTHVSFDGKLTLEADFSLAGDYTDLQGIEVTDDGIYGLSGYGGANLIGFIYRVVPGHGGEIVHNFTEEYRYRSLCIAKGNDGQVYGFASLPQSSESSPEIEAILLDLLANNGKVSLRSLVSQVIATVKVYKKSKKLESISGTRSFRLRKNREGAANLVPVAKLDTAWLPANATRGKRDVIVDVLANDRDPDKNRITITSATPRGSGIAEVVTTKAGPRVRFSISEQDPSSQLVNYEVSDGRGGISSAFIVIRASATGSFSGTATDSTQSSAVTGLLSVVFGKTNTFTASYTSNGITYTGKGTLDVDDTSDLSLIAKRKVPLNLHLGLQRGETRTVNATIVSGDAVYRATCIPVVAGKKK